MAEGARLESVYAGDRIAGSNPALSASNYFGYNVPMHPSTPTTHSFERHSYDLMLGHKSPMALRLNNARHSNVQVGDLVKFSGHNTIMDRQRFGVVGKMHHPTVGAALDAIKHSDMNIRDKIQMKQAFLDKHGPEAEHQPVVAYHLEHQPVASARNAITPFGFGE